MAGLAAEYPAHFPKSAADPKEIASDVTLAKTLDDFAKDLASFSEAVTDTVLAARSDAYRGGLKLYAIAHVVHAAIPGVEAKLASLAKALDRPARKVAAE